MAMGRAKLAAYCAWVVGQGMRLAGAGLIVGLIVAFRRDGASLGSLLFGVRRATIPLTFVGVFRSVGLGRGGSPATYQPRRAHQGSIPIIALRYEINCPWPPGYREIDNSTFIRLRKARGFFSAFLFDRCRACDLCIFADKALSFL